MNAILLLRPSQWTKNLLVFAPLFFGGALHDPAKAVAALTVFAAFCLVAGGGYAWNDIRDRSADAGHAEKKRRPVAAGKISSLRAGAIGFTATNAGIALTAAYVPTAALALGAYAALSAVYSLGMKRVPIAELLCFPAFYLMRVFAGGAATNIAVSGWLALCVIFISLFIVATKRKAEIGGATYSERFLENIAVIFGSAALMSYGIWCVIIAPSPYAVYSMLFPIAGIMRYLTLAEKGKTAECPERIIFGDPWTACIIIGWIAWTYALSY